MGGEGAVGSMSSVRHPGREGLRGVVIMTLPPRSPSAVSCTPPIPPDESSSDMLVVDDPPPQPLSPEPPTLPPPTALSQTL